MIKKILLTIFSIFIFLIILGLIVGDNTPSNQNQTTENNPPTKILTEENQENNNEILPEENNPEIEGLVDENNSEQVQQENQSSTQEQNQKLYRVVKITDGDTIKVDIGGVIESVRLVGIDTAETVDPRKSVECFGVEASNKAKEILTGKSVYLESDSVSGDRGIYGRLLRYVFLEDSTHFNKLMISEGYAYEYTYNSIPYKYQAEFKQAEKEARENKRGLWADGVCEGETVTQPATPEPAPPINENENLSCDCSGNKYNCSDFKTHNEAQNLYDCCIREVGYDVHRLDRDNDGIVCESLP
jgi:micrococcal nuclease